MKFGIRKLESWGYQSNGERIRNHDARIYCDASFLRFDTYRLVTDGRTDTHLSQSTRARVKSVDIGDKAIMRGLIIARLH